MGFSAVWDWRPQRRTIIRGGLLAERRGVTQRSLERWHSIGWEPLFLKMGGHVVYREKGVLACEVQHLAESTQSRVCNRQT